MLLYFFSYAKREKLDQKGCETFNYSCGQKNKYYGRTRQHIINKNKKRTRCEREEKIQRYKHTHAHFLLEYSLI